MTKPTRILVPFTLLTCSIALILNVTDVHASILNGSFELRADDGNGGAGAGRLVYTAPSTSITGWTLEGVGDVYLHISPAIGSAIGANFNSAQDGNTYLDLSGGIGGGTSGDHATIYQNIVTVPSQSYELSFYIGAAFAPSATINVKLDGGASLLDQTLTAAAPSTNIVWTPKTFSFVADSALTKLSFKDVSGGDDNVSFVDNVSVRLLNSAVPELSSCLCWIIIALCAAVRTRR